ncbi:uncharacterized protein LOC136092029 [Hydra vulgaris]|uniref:Uncharacterized protein LOC136092029 n=1 Tax=Hydra vulgaris TaxID=6087 RepID=A0ABM4DMM0_HYDVU
MSSIQAKRRIRTVNIKLLHKLFEKSLELIERTDDENQFNYLSDLKDTLNEKYNKVIQLDEEISLLIEDEDELENELESSTEFNLTFKNEISKISKQLKKFDLKTDCNSTLSSFKNKTVKLPVLKLDNFDGKPEKWTSFIENFDCAINANNDLSGIQKMTYLRNLLRGPALSSISGLSLSNENYKVALDILKERYDNKQNMISSHMKKLLSLERVHNLNKIDRLRYLLDSIEIQIRSLENLKITSEMYGPLLIPIILQKIPDELNLIINRQIDNNSTWDVMTVINILKTEIRAREQVSLNLNNNGDISYTAETFFTSNNNYKEPNHNRNPQYKFSNKIKEKLYFDRNSPTNLQQFVKCIFCDKPHRSQYCKSITNIQNRKRIISDKHLCFKCLGSGHVSKNCRSRIRCFKCGNHHHVALCLEQQHNELQNKGELTAISGNDNQSILLQTASTDVFDRNSKLHNCRILFDNCSQLSYISPDLCRKLKLKSIGKKNINIKTFGNNNTKERLEKVELKVKCLFGRIIKIICYVKDICAPINGQYINLAQEKYKHLHNLRLADSNLQNGNLRIDVLIGADYYWLFIENSIIRGNHFDPIAIRSKLGYLLSGPINVNNMFKVKKYDCWVNTAHVMLVGSNSSPDSLLKESMTSIWGVGEMNECNLEVVDRFRHTIKYDNTLKRYNVNLPFKENHPPLSDNYNFCIKRFKSLQKKLGKDDWLLESYNNVFKEQLQQGIIEPIIEENKIENAHYLPHQPVLRNDKITTKVRIVFDASSSVDGPSLNDCLYPGPSLTTSLYGILLRFRAQKIAFVADIEKAFLQIALAPADRDYVRFLWFKNINTLNKVNIFTQEIISYRICRVLFGVTSSSFLLTATLITHAEKYLIDDPVFVHKLSNSLHVNDLNSGADSVDSAFDFYKKCHVRLKEAGFTLRKFESNCKHLENLVNEQNFTSFNITKVLGLLWNKKEDKLIFDFRNLIHNDDLNPTKRKVLQFIASIFDPLGIVNPFIVKCKIFFQKLCIDKLNWDKPLEGKTLLVWQAIINDIKTSKPIIIPRWYHNHYPNQVVDLSLHGFSDASNSAYGCCIYLLCSFNDKHVSCSLITAKSRIAQIKNTSIPRLELKAALLLAETMSAVKKELYPVLKFKQILCWCDSTIVLHWINNTDKVMQPFFQERIKKIIRQT